jgi:hypothetical protein
MPRNSPPRPGPVIRTVRVPARVHACGLGRRDPLHLPLFSNPLAKVIIREEHMQQALLRMPPRAPTPRVPGWKPRFPNYREGLDQVIGAWGN